MEEIDRYLYSCEVRRYNAKNFTTYRTVGVKRSRNAEMVSLLMSRSSYLSEWTVVKVLNSEEINDIFLRGGPCTLVVTISAKPRSGTAFQD